MTDEPVDVDPQTTKAALDTFDYMNQEAEERDLSELELIYAVWTGLISDLLYAGWTVEELQKEIAVYAGCGDGSGRIQ